MWFVQGKAESKKSVSIIPISFKFSVALKGFQYSKALVSMWNIGCPRRQLKTYSERLGETQLKNEKLLMSLHKNFCLNKCVLVQIERGASDNFLWGFIFRYVNLFHVLFIHKKWEKLVFTQIANANSRKDIGNHQTTMTRMEQP